MSHRIPFIKPNFPEPEELASDLRRIYKNNSYSNNGPVYFEFIKEIEKYLGQNIKAVAVSNATLGLMLALQASIKESDSNKKHIAVPSFTFAAGPLAIKWCGFEPIFFDINSTTLQPSLESFQELLEDHADDLAAILLTNSFGIGNEEIAQWEKISINEGVPLVIDSAPGIGSAYEDGNLLGGRGACEVFSLHVTKPFGIGEGGLITTKNTNFKERLESLKNFGFNTKKQTTDLGLNAKITELDCAIGLRVLENYPDTLADRRETYKKFKTKLSDSEVIFLPRAETASIQFVSIIVDPTKKTKVLEALSNGGVDARTYYAPAVHTFPLFAGALKMDLSETELISERIISLPLHPNMDSLTIEYICDIVKKELG